MTAASWPRMFFLVNLALSIVTVAAWHTVRIATTSHAPTIKVRWKDSVTDAERRSLERAFQLVNREPTASGVDNYDLIDSRAAVIRAVVEHPAVEATGDIDVARFTISTSAERGDTTRWLWHRWGRFDTGRVVAATLHLWLVLSGAAAVVMTRSAGSGVVTNRTIAHTPPR